MEKIFKNKNKKNYCQEWKVIITKNEYESKECSVTFVSRQNGKEQSTPGTYFLSTMLNHYGDLWIQGDCEYWNIEGSDFAVIKHWLYQQSLIVRREFSICEVFDDMEILMNRTNMNENYFALMFSLKKQYNSIVKFPVPLDTKVFETLTSLCYKFYEENNFLDTDKIAKTLLTVFNKSGYRTIDSFKNVFNFETFKGLYLES